MKCRAMFFLIPDTWGHLKVRSSVKAATKIHWGTRAPQAETNGLSVGVSLGVSEPFKLKE